MGVPHLIMLSGDIEETARVVARGVGGNPRLGGVTARHREPSASSNIRPTCPGFIEEMVHKVGVYRPHPYELRRT
jgi:hypothetical protein